MESKYQKRYQYTIILKFLMSNVTRPNTRGFMNGLKEERRWTETLSQCELYWFIRCMTIKGLFLLDMIQNIDCSAVPG